MARWSQDLAVLAAKTGLSLDTTIRKASFDVFRSIVLKSPVKTGRFRANWNFSISQPDFTTTDSTNQERGLSEAARVLQQPSGGIVCMSNGLPYARRLEHGWSKKAPYGMVRYSALEYQRFLLRAIY